MNQKKEKIHLLKTWKKNNWCEQIDFSDKEIYGLFRAIGEFYAHKKTDDIMFRGSIDQDANFTQQEFVLAYRAEMLRDKIKRRLLSSFYVKIQGKLGTGLLPKCCQKRCGRKDFGALAKAHHLSDREVKKFELDYKELKKAYKNLQPKGVKHKVMGMIVLPNF